MRAANDLARLHICTVSPEPSLIALKWKDVNEGSVQIVYQLMWLRYLSHMRAAKHQASLYIRTVSPETSLIALKGRDIDEGSGQIVYTSSCDLVTYRIFEQQKTRRACTSHRFARAFADCTKKKGCRWRLRPNWSYQFMWFRCLTHIRAEKDQASMHICAVLPDNVWFSICLWARNFDIHLREKWEKNCLDDLGFFTCTKVNKKIVHTKKKLLSTAWQTYINS